MSKQIQYIVVFLDGDEPRLNSRYFGPFVSFDMAYDFLCELPAPIPGGHKFVHPTQPYLFSEARTAREVITSSRVARERSKPNIKSARYA